MPRLPKVSFHNTVLFVTTSIEEGLLLPANPLMNLLFYSAASRAQHLSPITICHFLVEATHVHFIIKVNDPSDVKRFMERFKTESAHYINRLLGRKKRTIWCEGYDSPILLTEEDVIDKIVYIYSNPAKDFLESSIDKYPGANSWKAFRNGKITRICPWTNRSMISKIPTGELALGQYRAYANTLSRKSTKRHTFEVRPNAWMECFRIENQEEQQSINHEINNRLQKRESEYQDQRQKEGKGVIGAAKLRRQNLDLSYLPDRKGRKMWCICSDLSLRAVFVEYIKSLVELAKRVYKRWKVGDFSVSYPLGLYPPCMPKLAEALGCAVIS